MLEQRVVGNERREKEPQLESFHDGYVFRVDYAPETPDLVLEHDLTTYLAEYRLKIQKAEYELLYTRGPEGNLALRSSDNGESMLAIGRKGIQERERQGKPIAKETADLLGMQQIEHFMQHAVKGETILWASPPDPTVGYEYGFFYIGEVEQLGNEEKKLNMRAVRLDNNPTLGQFNQALTHLSGSEQQFVTINQFISHPIHLSRSIHEQELDFVLRGTFEFRENCFEEERKREVLELLTPYFDTFKRAVRENAPLVTRQRILFAIENVTLMLEQRSVTETSEDDKYHSGDIFIRQQDDPGFIAAYGYRPPQAVGSCDIPQESALAVSSPNIFGVNAIFSETPTFLTQSTEASDKYGKRTFKCPYCNHENKRPYNKLIKYCQNTETCGKDVSC